MRGWFEAAQVDAFACSHTCLPVFRALPISTRAQPAWVLNNGATGMPNFRSDGAGLFTRIGLRPFAGPALARRHGLVQDGVLQQARCQGGRTLGTQSRNEPRFGQARCRRLGQHGDGWFHR